MEQTLLEKAQALLEARADATPGEWKTEAYEDSDYSPRCSITSQEHPEDDWPTGIVSTEGIGGQYVDACHNTRFIALAANTACETIRGYQDILRRMADALQEAQEEIAYWHPDMLDEDARAHPRGSGWARVYDKNKAALEEASAALPHASTDE